MHFTVSFQKLFCHHLSLKPHCYYNAVICRRYFYSFIQQAFTMHKMFLYAFLINRKTEGHSIVQVLNSLLGNNM